MINTNQPILNSLLEMICLALRKYFMAETEVGNT